MIRKCSLLGDKALMSFQCCFVMSVWSSSNIFFVSAREDLAVTEAQFRLSDRLRPTEFSWVEMALHVELRHIYRDGSSRIDGNQIAFVYECLGQCGRALMLFKAEIWGMLWRLRETHRIQAALGGLTSVIVNEECQSFFGAPQPPGHG